MTTLAFTRADRSVLANWWWTVDRLTMIALFLLAGSGLLLCLAASPAVANRLGYAEFHFFYRQLVFMPAALVALLAGSILSPRGVRRIGLLIFLAGLIGMVLAVMIGPEVNGAQRWLSLGSFKIQPSEFAKPGFVIMVAWALAAARARDGVPGDTVAFVLLIVTVGVLVKQPDYGQSVLIIAVWAILYFMAGVSAFRLVVLAAVGVVFSIAAYTFEPHVQSRVDRYLDPSSGDNYQMKRTMESVSNGGFFGLGPGEGEAKIHLPDAHTDFIFAVAAEEFGLMVCLILVLIFGFVVLRGFLRVFEERDHFVQLAASGLFALFGLQAVINMGVNLNMLPAKGMTLPFISYGGSSGLAIGLTMGLALALTRERAGKRKQAISR